MSLRIAREASTKPGQRQPLPEPEGAQFEQAANTALEQLRGSTLGAQLLKEIQEAAPELLLVKPAAGCDNSCAPEQQSAAAAEAASYQELQSNGALLAKIEQLLKSHTIAQDHAAVRKHTKFRGPGSLHVATVMQMGKPFDVRLAHKPKNDRPHSTDVTLRNRIAFADDDNQIGEARGLVDYLQNGLIGYHLMDHLTPGVGIAACAVWDPALERVDKEVAEDKRAAWMVRPPWVALAHELIHGWRLVTGRCVFRPAALIENYYEEAMTVGLPPYDGCKFSENRFRQAKGLALRTFYGQTSRAQSEHAQQKHGGVEKRLALNH